MPKSAALSSFLQPERDRAIHDLQVAWDTIALDLDPLAKAIQGYLEQHPR